ncbi:MAG: DUF4382 domain-containing protein [Lewinellaceae bacterium]|nr:DUF4382 domain-containing protein [Lewinella sp.]MCB9279735.1 DUF4382 domain-containing protein [Lewinellaceae bacterium]
MSNKRFFHASLLVLSVSLFFTACKKDDPDIPSGQMQLEVTDGPVDDANVKAVFVTVTDVKIDGRSWDGFSGATTIDLMSYQNGSTKLLGNGSLEGKAYSNIVLVLDYDQDASGAAPGCYVVDNKGAKIKLTGSGTQEIKIKGNFQPDESQRLDLVADFDLRKALTYDASNSGYMLATASELETSLRLVVKSETGAIHGTCTDAFSGADKIVVYAYEKGQFDLETEKMPQGASEIQFKNAVTSAAVANNGDYQLSFLESGDYELHFVAYKDDNADGELEAMGVLNVNIVGGLDILGLNLAAALNLDVDVVVTGVTPL